MLGGLPLVTVDGQPQDSAPPLRQNPALREDVNGDSLVTAVDVLLLVNYLNAHVDRTSALPAAAPPQLWLDVTDDGAVTPVDVLTVINHINRFPPGAPEGEEAASSAWFADSAALAAFPDSHRDPSYGLPGSSPAGTAVAQDFTTAGHRRLVPLAPASTAAQRLPLVGLTGPQHSRLPGVDQEPEPSGLHMRFAELDEVLPDIAADVHRGWIGHVQA